MGCSYSILRSLVGSYSESHPIFSFNGKNFLSISKLGEGGFAYVYLVKDMTNGREFALKKILAQTEEQLKAGKNEIQIHKKFQHENLLPLLDAAVVPLPAPQGTHAVYLLFPAFQEGTLQNLLTKRASAGLPPLTPMQVLSIFDQMCAGVEALHSASLAYVHWDLKLENVLVDSLTPLQDQEDSALLATEDVHLSIPQHHRNQGLVSGSLVNAGGVPRVVVMDLGSARPANHQVSGRGDAMRVMEEAERLTSPLYRAPELWDLDSHAVLDTSVDIWSLGCALYGLMYSGTSPFETHVAEAGGSLALAVLSGNLRWPCGGGISSSSTDQQQQQQQQQGQQQGHYYPAAFRRLVQSMMQVDPRSRPTIGDIRTQLNTLLKDPNINRTVDQNTAIMSPP